MKKIIVALFATLGLSSAFAQSNVQIYGILDLGYIGGSYKGIVGNPAGSQTFNTIGTNAESASRLGFRGQEDLGGGTAAVFTIETGLNPSNSTLSTFNTRQAFVGLKQTGYGQLAVGVQNTPVYNAVVVTDPGALDNIVGNVIFPSTPQNNGNQGSNPYAATGSSGYQTDGFTVRASNTLSFISEKFNNGIGFQVSGIANNSSQTQTGNVGGQNNFSGYGFNVNYTYQKFYGVVAYQALRSAQTGQYDYNIAPTIWSGTGGGVNSQDNQTYAGGTYDFDYFKAYVQYINRKATSVLDSNQFARRTAQQVGIRGFVTPTIEPWASVGTGTVSAFGVNNASTSFTGYQVGSNYYLSKRTNLYAMFGQTNGANVPTTTGSYPISATNYAVGIKHVF